MDGLDLSDRIIPTAQILFYFIFYFYIYMYMLVDNDIGAIDL